MKHFRIVALFHLLQIREFAERLLVQHTDTAVRNSQNFLLHGEYRYRAFEFLLAIVLPIVGGHMLVNRHLGIANDAFYYLQPRRGGLLDAGATRGGCNVRTNKCQIEHVEWCCHEVSPFSRSITAVFLST